MLEEREVIFCCESEEVKGVFSHRKVCKKSHLTAFLECRAQRRRNKEAVPDTARLDDNASLVFPDNNSVDPRDHAAQYTPAGNLLRVLPSLALSGIVLAMPITSSAKRAIRVAERKRVYNLRRTNAMKDAVKEVRKLAAAGKSKEAEAKLSGVYQAIDKAAKRGVIKKNTAARKKSRIVALLRRPAKKAA